LATVFWRFKGCPFIFREWKDNSPQPRALNLQAIEAASLSAPSKEGKRREAANHEELAGNVRELNPRMGQIGAHSDGIRAKRERGSDHRMSEELEMIGSNNTAKPKTVKDLDLNDNSTNARNVAYIPHFLNQFRSPPLSNACTNRSKNWTLYATYLSKFTFCDPGHGGVIHGRLLCSRSLRTRYG
jgi:hypothetical protein